MRTLILGLDAFDPQVFERLSEQGRLPNLTRYVEAGGYSRLEVSNPPQTEVSWTSIATGLNPGGHGIFDFVHRDPATYTPYVSMLPTSSGLFGTRFVPPYKARTIFEETTRQGFPATALWWPVTFPARPELSVRTLPGLGTPDIQGRLGVGTLFSTDADLVNGDRKMSVKLLEQESIDRYAGVLEGPARKTRGGKRQSTLDFRLEVTGEGAARLNHVRRHAVLMIGDQTVDLLEGQWSPILDLSFKVGLLLKIHALTRVILSQVGPDVKLYFLPLQLHPLRSPWRYASPGGFVKETWRACGPFLTVGWPQDTTGLEEGAITDDQFLALCKAIHDDRERVLMHHLQGFREGILASVFDSLDRVQHMFWRDRPDIVEGWYEKLDALVGRVDRRSAELGTEQIKLFVLSDHGFADFDYKVHLNRWLINHGYMVANGNGTLGSLRDVDWQQSQAYAVGLNSVYLNVSGREGQGVVQLAQCEALVERIRDDLSVWRGPDARPVVQQAWRRDEVFEGPLADRGPDIVVGYSPGYRASSETGLGKWKDTSIEPNRDHWGGDHCITSQAVPGVLFSNQDLKDHPRPSYRDIPALTIGTEISPSDTGPPPPSSFSDEDQEVIEERLRSLGYL